MMPFDGERLTRSMRARNVDVVLATSRHNVRYLTGGYYLSFYARALPEASFADATPILADLRAVKRPDELERLRQVHQMTAEAIRAVLAEGRPEETTRQIAARAQRRIEERGASFLYAFTNVGPGFLRAPSSERWGRGRSLHMDVGAAPEASFADVAR